MTMDVSIPALVDAAGGAAFVLVGIVALLARGADRDRLLLAGVTIPFGVSFVIQNLWLVDEGSSRLVVAAAAGLASLAGAALAWRLSGPLSAGPRALVVAALLADVGLTGLALANGPATVGARYGAAPELAQVAGLAVIFATCATFVLVPVSLAVALRGEALGEGWSRVGLALGLFPALNAERLFAASAAEGQLQVTLLFAALLIGVWLVRRPRVAWALLAACSVGLAVSVATFARGNANAFDFGVNGAARTLAATLLCLALLKGEILGIEPPGFLTRRGPAAAVALATVFVVAQIAQNFFAAKYGLILGGVVAGSFLFAAKPIEAALERGADAPASDARARRVYREAVRHALRGRPLRRDDEIHLAELAEEMAIPTAEAVRIRHEVEDEAGLRAP